jgi:cyclophilin family peptidyl-prolyl cis-trans isomerase
VLQNLLAFMHDQGARQSLYVISDRDYYDVPLADYIDVDLTQRYAALWMIEDLAKRRNSSADSMRNYIQNNNESNFFINVIAEDFLKHKPSLVFVDNRKFNINDSREHLDLLNAFQNNKMFLQEWRHYAYLTTLSAGPTEENFGDYNLDVYKRID